MSDHERDLAESLEFYQKENEKLVRENNRLENKLNRRHCTDCKQKKFQRCACCEKAICIDCARNGPMICDWISDANNVCKECETLVCHQCFRWCLDCVNCGKESEMVCKNCVNNLVKVQGTSRAFRYKCEEHANDPNHLISDRHCSHPMD